MNCRHCGFDHEFTGGKCVKGSRTAREGEVFRPEPVTRARDKVTRPRDTKTCPRCKGKGHVPAPLSAAERQRALRQRKP